MIDTRQPTINAHSIVEKFESQDPHQVWSATWEILSAPASDELLKLLPHLKRFRTIIATIDLKGMIYSNEQNAYHACDYIEGIAAGQCRCHIYLKLLQFRPKPEATAGHITIDQHTILYQAWEKHYEVRCNSCGAPYLVREVHGGHVPWYEWKPMTKTNTLAAELHNRLCHTLLQAGVNDTQAVNIAIDLIKRYQEPWRHYHTLEHIHFLLQRLQTAPLENRAAVELLTWFHDAIYNPKRKDNEAKSAELAKATLSGLVDSTTLHIVVEGTLLSQHHQRSDNSDINHFLDADLGVFAQPAETYAIASAAVRKEYAHLPNWLYRFGRKRVLKGMLARQPFYLTDWASEWETLARQNIHAELG